MKKGLPDKIKEVGFDFDWDNKKLWKLDVPTTEMDTSELVWHFDYPFHWDVGEYDLTSKEIFENPERYKKEFDRTLSADLRYPIDIMKKNGRWVILDGLHRLMKAYHLGMQKVQVRIITKDRLPEILKE